MRKNTLILLLIFSIIILSGCCKVKNTEQGPVLARINNYSITLPEFEAEFKDSSYALNDNLESRKEFLALLINRKLILQDAQKNNLDKQKDFLKTIERFWEQSLLKLAIERKNQEITQNNTGLTKERETQLVNEWISRLHNDARIQIKYELLETRQ